jgi:hypothetical protein
VAFPRRGPGRLAHRLMVMDYAHGTFIHLVRWDCLG